jgi:hypothetical protein
MAMLIGNKAVLCGFLFLRASIIPATFLEVTPDKESFLCKTFQRQENEAEGCVA